MNAPPVNITSLAGGGSFGGTGGSSPTTITTTDSSQSTGTAQTANAPIITGGEGSTLSYVGSDYGALSAASSIYNQALDLSKYAIGETTALGRFALGEGSDTVKKQGAGALALITKPFLIFFSIVALAAVAGYYLYKKAK